MKKAQARQSKEILKEKGGVVCAERLVFRLLRCAEDLFNYIGYAEKSLLPEQIAHIYIGIEQMKEMFEITDEEIDTEINYALEVAHENLDLK